jgi:hypothetical protein
MVTEESKQIFCWGEIVREIYVSRAGDPFHAGDKALTLETPAQRVRVNRYDVIDQSMIINFEMKKIFEVKPSKILGILHRLQCILIYSPSSNKS